jgi:hypothetical protein
MSEDTMADEQEVTPAEGTETEAAPAEGMPEEHRDDAAAM